MSDRRAYRSDLSDARWALIEPILTKWRADRVGLGISPPVRSLRETTNAILYVNRTGIQWEYLPHDFPPAKTVYDYYAKWQADGTSEAVHNALRHKVRVHKGREVEPTEMMVVSTSRRGLTREPTDLVSFSGSVGLGREVLVHSPDVA